MSKDPWQKKIAAFLGNERERLVGYVRRFIDDTAERDGEDIVQDVILNLFNRADVTIPIENVTAYVYRALRNRIIDYLRKKRDVVSLDEEFSRTEDLTLSDILPDPRSDRFDDESRLEIRQHLFKALSILNDEQRAVIIETELEGRTFKELSEEWGVPVGTLLARKSRAIQKIRDSFSGLGS
ncbi:MAG: RNA polymerase sigma factor [Deltaproteobacteria bacterium]|nr:RNA polymerase sigma factor [Deltaproteobacteria bacterium]